MKKISLQIFYRVVIILGIIIVTVYSNAILFQQEKDEIFMEAFDAFSEAYKVERDQILNQFGITTHEAVKEAQEKYKRSYL